MILLCREQILYLQQELTKREMERKNRCVGFAEASYEYLYPKEGYDLTVNTFTCSLEECSQNIYKYLLGIQ